MGRLPKSIEASHQFTPQPIGTLTHSNKDLLSCHNKKRESFLVIAQFSSWFVGSLRRRRILKTNEKISKITIVFCYHNKAKRIILIIVQFVSWIMRFFKYEFSHFTMWHLRWVTHPPLCLSSLLLCVSEWYQLMELFSKIHREWKKSCKFWRKNYLTESSAL